MLRPATPQDELRLEDFVAESFGSITLLRAPKPPAQRRDSFQSICSSEAAGHLEVPRRRRKATVHDEEADWVAFSKPEVHLDAETKADHRAYMSVLG
jgi:hypothetical protein